MKIECYPYYIDTRRKKTANKQTKKQETKRNTHTNNNNNKQKQYLSFAVLMMYALINSLLNLIIFRLVFDFDFEDFALIDVEAA